MITRVLFIDSDARALARIKGALEQAGPYEANVFVTGHAALEYTADHPPSLAVIALSVTDIPPTQLVTQLRELVPGLPVLLRAPADTDRQILQTINAQGMLEGGYTARTLVNLMNDALHPRSETPSSRPSIPSLASIMPPGSEQIRPPLPRSGHPDDDMSTFDQVLDTIEPDSPITQEDTFHQLVKSMQSQPDPRSLPQRRERLVNWAADDDEQPAATSAEPAPDALFEKLADEEPPPPALEDSGTVSDLIAVTDFNEHRAESPVAELPEDMLLGLDALSETDEQRDLLKAISEIDEPPSKEIDLDSMPERLGYDQADPQSIPAAPETVAELTPIEPAAPPEPAPEVPSQPEPRPLRDVRIPVTRPAQKQASPPIEGDEPAARALQLTAHNSDSKLEATVLVRDGRIIASTGELPQTDLEALIAAIDYEGVLANKGTKVKFISLPELHLSYVVAAAPSIEDMVLLSIFSEDMSLGAIHGRVRAIARTFKEAEEAQAAQLAAEIAATEAAEASHEAESVDPNQFRTGVHSTGQDAAPVAPSTTPEVSAPPPATSEPPVNLDPDTLVKYAIVWLLNDPAGELSPDLVEALGSWLLQIVASHGWLAEQVDVQPDYVSVVVGTSPEEAPGGIPAALMAETARRIVAARPEYGSAETLWADAHLMVTPGRPLTGQEISQFISYQRQH